MRVSNPGGLLALFAILAPLVLGWAIYAHWWPIAALFAPIALCHIGLLFRIRPAAYVLLAAYIVNSLAAYEVHVARYYYRRGAYVAAANRAQLTVQEFQQWGNPKKKDE